MTSLLQCLMPPTHSEVLAGVLCCSDAWLWSILFALRRTTAPAIFRGKSIIYWSPVAKINVFVVEEYGGGCGIIAAALAFSDIVQESFFINLCLEFKRHFLCVLSQDFSIGDIFPKYQLLAGILVFFFFCSKESNKNCIFNRMWTLIIDKLIKWRKKNKTREAIHINKQTLISNFRFSEGFFFLVLWLQVSFKVNITLNSWSNGVCEFTYWFGSADSLVQALQEVGSHSFHDILMSGLGSVAGVVIVSGDQWQRLTHYSFCLAAEFNTSLRLGLSTHWWKYKLDRALQLQQLHLLVKVF